MSNETNISVLIIIDKNDLIYMGGMGNYRHTGTVHANIHIIIKQGIYQYDPNETEHKVNNIEQAVTVL